MLFKSLSMGELCLTQSRADRAMHSVVTKQLEPFRLTMMEWLVLVVVSGGSKEGLSMTRIANALDVTLPQVTALVTTLLHQKLVTQKTLETDRRGRQVNVTLRGRRTLAKLESSIAWALNEWSGHVSEERMREYVETVELLSQNAE